jgi:hypothetical protein
MDFNHARAPEISDDRHGNRHHDGMRNRECAELSVSNQALHHISAVATLAADHDLSIVAADNDLSIVTTDHDLSVIVIAAGPDLQQFFHFVTAVTDHVPTGTARASAGKQAGAGRRNAGAELRALREFG